MAVPTSYTIEEFADYLKDDVLGDAADGLGFGDYVPEIPQITNRVIIRLGLVGTFGSPPYNYTNGLPIYQTGFTIPAGTSLTWSNGQTRTLANTIDPTDTTMDISGLGANFQPNDYATRVLRAAVAKVRNPIYVAIAEEVLTTMALSDLTDVNSTNIEVFRAYGRVELLRKVMQNIAGNYNYVMPVGGQLNSNNVYTQVTRMFQLEQRRLNGILARIGTLTPEVPGESNSQSGNVVVVW